MRTIALILISLTTLFFSGCTNFRSILKSESQEKNVSNVEKNITTTKQERVKKHSKDEDSNSDEDTPKEGYLKIREINRNITKQLPLIEIIGRDKLEISTLYIMASPKSKRRIRAELEFKFYSFEIPEGMEGVARVDASIYYDTKRREFKLTNLKNLEIKYIKDSLLEYVSREQVEFIKETIIYKLKEIILYRSKKRLRAIKGFEVKNGKIKILFK